MEVQKDRSWTLDVATNWQNPNMEANGVVDYVTTVVDYVKQLAFPSRVAKATLVAWGQRHIALTSEIFVLSLSRCGEESRWSLGEGCREVYMSARRTGEECTLALVEYSVVGVFRKLSFHLIESSLSARMKWSSEAWSMHHSSRADD